MGLIDDLVADAKLRAKALPRRGLSSRNARPDFARALGGKERLDVIAEYKQASPSLGDIATRSVELRARSYQQAGAAAMSVLTEPSHFRGSLDDLEAAAAVAEIPVLMKDFVVDVAQIEEAAFRGASAVLLIARCLSESQLDELASCSDASGLTPLVECHDGSEIERALRIEGAVLGVNNRDLDTLDIDLALAPMLLAEIPAHRVAVAESGYHGAADVDAVRGIANAVLIGSALMRRDDPASLIEEIRA